MQDRPDAERAEEARQRSIALYAEDAKAWDTGQNYYIAKLSLGGTIAGLTEHRDVEGEDVRESFSRSRRSAGICTTSATCTSHFESVVTP
jgi:hypothetical protein